MADFKAKMNGAQGSHYLRLACQLSNIPPKVGELEFKDVGERAAIQEGMRSSFRTLRAYSPIYQKYRTYVFGPTEFWEEILVQPKEGAPPGLKAQRGWKEKEGDRPIIEVRFDEDGQYGIYWSSVFSVHPDSALCLPPGDQEELVWPVLRELELDQQVRQELGLQARKFRKILSNADLKLKAEADARAKDAKTAEETKKAEERK